MAESESDGSFRIVRGRLARLGKWFSGQFLRNNLAFRGCTNCLLQSGEPCNMERASKAGGRSAIDIGIQGLSSPDRIVLLGHVATPASGDVVLYWPCGGATIREIARKAKLPLLTTDYPGSGFVTDKRAEELAVF